MARVIIVEDNVELASLIVAAVTTRGHQAQAAHFGKDALERLRAEPFELAIVDLMLPDIAGTEILDALKGTATRAFVMSGLLRDPRAARDVQEKHGADRVFVKPFDLGDLLDAIDGLDGEPVAPSEPGLDDFSELDALPSTDGPVPEDESDFEMPFARRDRVWAQARREAATGALPAWTRAGPIQPGSVPKLLTAFFQARHSGELKLTQGAVVKVVCFEAGVPIYAASNLVTERFGRFCARRGLFPEAELHTVATLAKENNLRTGEAMVRLGLLSREQREKLLVEQVKEIIWSTFSWDRGEFSFSPRRVKAGDFVRLEVFPGDLILEGVLRTESLLTLRKKVAAHRRFFPNPDPPYELHALTLEGAQAMLLAYSDGSKTVEDLLALTDLSEREALGTLRGLELLGVIEEREPDQVRSRISFAF